MQAEHKPVLAQSIREMIQLKSDAVVVDATVGFAGHSRIFAETLDANGTLIGLDVDQKCLETAKENLKDLQCRVLLVHANFSEIAEVMQQNGIEAADLIFADLGICSGQLADMDRGLSFGQDMKLDMRLDDRLEVTAADIVNNRDEKGLADLIYEFGEERASRKIARSIVDYRHKAKIKTTGQLADIICKAFGCDPNSRRSKLHPATKTFQALRIAVNDELGNLEIFLNSIPSLLKKHGRAAIISFHSLEDRIVKNNFRSNKAAGVYDIITKKPIIADRTEVLENPRSRSAKLRIAEKI
ncbi:MAG: 16S rRNA (cytosine(1402)-N(4))-methyltransferase [Planctomycetes bacterium GWF2_41_51]|nr:MAG: 16S rRNA (cytosine(1402)-N(4))-methyltransferase [Planctomycetes bacterium GWF2_41_51]HBG27248.1 16S rRNA (cytosine(1402)-N(4))-methyltransferase [Phycisphaerales bacterium]